MLELLRVGLIRSFVEIHKHKFDFAGTRSNKSRLGLATSSHFCLRLLNRSGPHFDIFWPVNVGATDPPGVRRCQKMTPDLVHPKMDPLERSGEW